MTTISPVTTSDSALKTPVEIKDKGTIPYHRSWTWASAMSPPSPTQKEKEQNTLTTTICELCSQVVVVEMTRIETIARPTGRRRSRAADAGGGLLSAPSSIAILLVCCCCLLLSSSVLAGEPTIPRSTNRYSDYNRQSSPTGSGASSSSSVGSISSSFSPHDYQPPWNPSPKIDPHGFLADLYPRSPGDWEHLANIRGKYGPRQRSYPRNLLTTPVEIRQVPGDGNCLFHSIAACLHQAANGTHLPMDSHERILELRCKSLELRNAAVDVLQNLSGKGRRKLFLQGDEYLEARELLAAAAAQFELEGEEYCELMRKESYWGGGPEIVALCNHLQRPIHM